MNKFSGFKSYFFKKPDADANSTFLIVGLGNPGRQYRQNRHNIGFMLVDRLAIRLEFQFSRLQSKALIGKTIYQDRHLIIAKPQTFMNLSGQAVSGLLNFYKIPYNQLIIAYDDVDLPFGSIRLRPSGGSAGHKGMNSIIEKLGTRDFPRLRLGISRPPGRMEAAAYVLQDFNKSEITEIELFLERAVDCTLTFIIDGMQAAMNRYNNPE